MRRAHVLILALAAGLSGAAAAQPAAAVALDPSVLVVGDSLAVGVRVPLGDRIEGRPATYSVRSGITTPQGMTRLRGALTTRSPQVVVISLGTNDGSNPFRFASRLARTLVLVPKGSCIVWPAVHRAARKGTFRALNRVLRAAAVEDPRLHVLGWDRMVDNGTVRLPDGVHPDAAGYRARAMAIERTIRAQCPPPQLDGGAVAPT